MKDDPDKLLKTNAGFSTSRVGPDILMKTHGLYHLSYNMPICHNLVHKMGKKTGQFPGAVHQLQHRPAMCMKTSKIARDGNPLFLHVIQSKRLTA